MNSPDPRENIILKTFKKYGAKLMNGHGEILLQNKPVPEGTVIMFLAEPGYCMNIPTGQEIQRKFFESENNLKRFFKSGRPEQIHHVTNILSRTHFPGTTYRNMSISLKPNKSYKGMGYIKKLPIAEKSTLFRNLPPTFADTVGPIVPGKYRLSNLLKQEGPGVYVVSACRANINYPGNNQVYNISKSIYPGFPRKKAMRGTRAAHASMTVPYLAPKKGYRPLETTVPSTKHLNRNVRRLRAKTPRPPLSVGFRKVEKAVYGGGARTRRTHTFRKVLESSGLPANTVRSHKKYLERLKKHFNSGSGVKAVSKLRSGRLLPRARANSP
jgi:hypothetical protein